MRLYSALNLITHDAIGHTASLLTLINHHAIIKFNVALHSVNAADDIAVGVYIALGLFNLIPIPPLDGSKLLYTLFRIPERVELVLEQYGLPLLFLFIFLFSYPINLFISFVLSFYIGILV